MKRPAVWLAVLAAGLIGVATWFGYRCQQARTVVAQYLPAVTPATGWPEDFSTRWAAAEARAHSWLRARAGLVELSRLYHANGHYQNAQACYEGLSELEPANPRWLHLQANILAGFGRNEEALPLREKTVARAPEYLPARLRLGDTLLKSNRVPEAIRAYAGVLERVPDEPYALLGLARCDLATQDWAKAGERLRLALAQHPDFVGALSLLVTVSEHQGDRATAEYCRQAMSEKIFIDLPDPWFDELLEDCFDAYLLSVAASARNFAGERPAALALIDRAIALAPQSSAYRRQAGQYLLQDRNFNAASAMLKKAVEVNPADADSWLRYLDALQGLGLNQAYAGALIQGLANCPQSSGLHLQYARWLRSVNRLEEALGEFRLCYQLRPSEAAPLVEMGTTYVTAGRMAEAVMVLQQALERQPEHPSALATLAFIAINNRDEPEARRWFAQVSRQTRIPPELIDQLRQAFAQQFGRRLP